jgi:5-methylcytosine-specific restriction enzyme A
LLVAEPTAEKKLTLQKSHQHLYWRARWRNPKTGLEPACLRKHPLCADPFKIGCHNPSTVADHIIDHEGNEALFFDFNNLQGLCASCHSRKTGKTHGKGGRNIEDLSPLDANGRIRGNW